jgi:large subunit ribosomal protein L10
MDRSQKADLVDELKSVLTETSVVVVTRNLGLSVAQSTELRLKMRDAGAQFKVAKNRLALIAHEDTRYKPIGDLLTGPTALATSGDPVAAAKVAVDFVLSHLKQVNQLIDISGRSRFMQRLVAASHDAGLIPTLEQYANANLAATDRKPIQQAVDRIRSESAQIGRIRSETAAWLSTHPLG